LTIACVFWRGALIDVWNTSLSFLPSLARMPSSPRFQPASSSTWFASKVRFARSETDPATAYRLTPKGVQVALLFLFFHKRLCGPLAKQPLSPLP
jgi:hypothetical protein